MLAQAAGTGASAGTALVSESDMSVVVLMYGVNDSFPPDAYGSHYHREGERERAKW